VGETWLKWKIKNGHQEVVFGSCSNVKITHLPLDHRGDYKISPIVYILSGHVAKCKFVFGLDFKHGRFLCKFAMQVRIRHGIVQKEHMVTGKFKKKPFCMFNDLWFS
jgi:hypothetical protein